MSPPIASACWSRPPARCSWWPAAKARASRKRRRLDLGLHRRWRLLVRRHRHDPARDRAGAIARGRRRSHAQPQAACARWPRPPTGAFGDFLSARRRHRHAAVRRALQVLRRLRRRLTAPFVIDLGFSRKRLCRHREGRRAGRHADRRLCRRRDGARAAARDLPVDRRHSADGVEPVVRLAGRGRRQRWALTVAIIAENFTGAIGTVIFVAYLSALCQNPLHTATQFALLTALAAVGRTYLSSGGGFVAEQTGWLMFFVICALADLRACCCWPGCSARAFQAAGAEQATASASGRARRRCHLEDRRASPNRRQAVSEQKKSLGHHRHGHCRAALSRPRCFLASDRP